MLKRTGCILALITLVPVFGSSCFAQEGLASFGLSKAQARQQRALTEQRAQAMGLPLEMHPDSINVMQFQGFDEHGTPLYYITHNAEAARTISTNKLYAPDPNNSQYQFTLTGLNEVIGQWDVNRPLTTHQDLVTSTGDPRITVDWGVPADPLSLHATHVAGTLIGNPENSGNAGAKGMAFEALIAYDDFYDDSLEMEWAGANGLRLSNHSYGTATGWIKFGEWWYWLGDPNGQSDDYFGRYDKRAQEIDLIASNHPYYLMVRSAGNDRNVGPDEPETLHYVSPFGPDNTSTMTRSKNGIGEKGYKSISHAALAKNALTIGAINSQPHGYTRAEKITALSQSGYGPASDGRIKPDLVADGELVYSASSGGIAQYAILSGTSQAAASVTGSIALLRQHAGSLYPDQEFLASTWKALLIHTADEAGDWPGPDYEFGWGVMNSYKAATLLTDNAGSPIHIFEDSLLSENSLYYADTVRYVVWSNGKKPLRATLCWTDPPGALPTSSTRALINDLELRIWSDSGVEIRPYTIPGGIPGQRAIKDKNEVDNVEQVVVETPLQGHPYYVTITNFGELKTFLQAYSLIVTGNIPCGQFTVEAGTDTIICPGSSIRLGVPEGYDTQGKYFSWTPEIGLDDPHSPNPVATPLIQTKYTVVATNDAGCMAVDDVMLTVLDNQPPKPEIDPLPPAECDCKRLILPSVTDNCTDDVSITRSNNTLDVPGEYSITWVYSDRSGNISTQQQEITVVDRTPPNIAFNQLLAYPSIPENGIVPDFLQYVDAGDNCRYKDRPMIRQYPEPGSRLKAGQDKIVFTATDSSGNKASCSLPILLASVKRNEVPRFDPAMRGTKPVWKPTEGAASFLLPTLELSRNYPNPFSSATTISYSLPADGYAAMTVYDTYGRIVSEPVHETQSAGNHAVTFDATNLPAGLYLCKLTFGGEVLWTRMQRSR